MKSTRKTKTRSVWLDWWFSWLLVPIALVVEILLTLENVYWFVVKDQGLLLLGSIALSFVIMAITGIRAWRYPKRNLPRFKTIFWFLILISSCDVIMLLMLPPDGYREHLTSVRFNSHRYNLATINSPNTYGHDLKLYKYDQFGIRYHIVCEYHLEMIFQDKNSEETVFSTLDQADVMVDSESQSISITIDDEPVCTYPK